MRGMIYALVITLATVYQLAAGVNSSNMAKAADSMDSPYYGLTNYGEQSPRFGWLSSNLPETKEYSEPKEEDTEYQESLRRAYNGRLTRSVYETIASRSQGASTVPFTTMAGEVDYTPEYIKKQGDQNKNYVVMISADWCAWCKRMYPMIDELRKEGYIVYIFETNRPEFKDFAALYNVRAYPTFIVYDQEKEIDRTVGRTNKDWFKERLKTRDEQKEVKTPEPVEPYDGL